MMGRSKSEAVAAEAIEAYREGNVREAIHTLVDWADKHVRNEYTAQLFKGAIDRELAEVRADVSKPDPDAPRCGHCGSSSTYYRTDGDVGCNNCPGIMPQEGGA